MTGIRTTDDLRDRCRVDDITGCWHWGAGCDGNGRPSLWLPELRRRVALGTAIGTLMTGHEPKRGVVWHCTCETTNCANPWHRKPGNRSSQMLAAKLKRSPISRARIAAGKRKNSALTDEAAQEIRESTEFLRIVAARHGVSISHAHKIRSGALRRPAGASVFTLQWRQAA